MSMLGYFRKRQKLIFIIMVALMVSFLVGFQGFEMIFGDGDRDATAAETRLGKLTFDELAQAGSDLRVLDLLREGFGRSMQQAAYASLRYQAVQQDDATIAYALLLKETQAAGLRMTDAEVQRMVAQLQEQGEQSGFDYQAVVTYLRQNDNLPEKAIHNVLRRWGLIVKNYEASTILPPPSQAELLHLYRDISEELKLRVVKVDPARFMDQVGEPTDEQLQALFDEYKGRLSGEFQGVDSFSFGYMEPAKASLAWLFISSDAVRRGAIPAEREIQAWIDAHANELVKEVPGETAQGDADTNAADSENGQDDEDKPVKPAVLKKVPMTPAEQRAKAIQELSPSTTSERFDELVTLARRAILSWKPSGDQPTAPQQPYLDAAASFELPAEDLLGRNILVFVVDEPTPLQEVVNSIAREADPRLAAICFPWGKHGDVSVDPGVKIKSIATSNVSVGEALKLVAANVEDLPELTWSMCRGFDDVLFTTSGVRFFPVNAGYLPLTTEEQLRQQPLLANARARGGAGMGAPTLLGMAFNAGPINPAGSIEVGQDGPLMTTWGDDGSGAVLWRLLDAVEPRMPEVITPELREKLVRDWKLRKAFELAKAKAMDITTAEKLQAWIEESKAEPIETKMLRRKDYGFGPQGPMGGGGFYPARVASLGFSDMAVDLFFLGKAFTAVAPQASQEGDYPQTSENVAAISLPSEGYVALVQRIDYRPAMEDGYEAMKQPLMSQLEMSAGMTALRQWFSLEDVQARVDYQVKQ